MPIQCHFGNLSPRDIDILNILWDTEKNMTASEIVSKDASLTMNTVQAVLRKLLKQNLIQIAEIVYSGKVLSRSFRPTLTPDDFAAYQLTSEFQRLHGNISKTTLVSALLETETDSQKALTEIEHLQQVLDEYKRKYLEE